MLVITLQSLNSSEDAIHTKTKITFQNHFLIVVLPSLLTHHTLTQGIFCKKTWICKHANCSTSVIMQLLKMKDESRNHQKGSNPQQQKWEDGTECCAEMEKRSLHIKMHHQSPAEHMTNYILNNTASEYSIQYFISKRMFSSSGNNQSGFFFFLMGEQGRYCQPFLKVMPPIIKGTTHPTFDTNVFYDF